ncbi:MULTISPECIES: BON domain-containing protein [Pseudomonas]|jgi:hyperosmotically inducible protein|uniref:BON domain-containing protein n=1 Tax=Serpens gallinarum TaxID=2763075 RepID=A0ABR8TKW5_9PSED|nr:BON domain-containing protein [Serpens gallinarum]MBD7976249.1 BON domain-containing protein [Serpens gallinarum]
MKNFQTSLTSVAIAAALSLPFASLALADNQLPQTVPAQSLLLAANDTMDEAGDAVSDTWITTKVKSTLLADDTTPGMEIEVETKNGVVSLSGTVATEAERDMAISRTKEIKGVRDVAADGLKVAE